MEFAELSRCSDCAHDWIISLWWKPTCVIVLIPDDSKQLIWLCDSITVHLNQSSLLVVEALLLGSMHAQMLLINATIWRGTGLRKDTAEGGWQRGRRGDILFTPLHFLLRVGEACLDFSMSVVPPFFQKDAAACFQIVSSVWGHTASANKLISGSSVHREPKTFD
jgi:hypothetical protein